MLAQYTLVPEPGYVKHLTSFICSYDTGWMVSNCEQYI